MRYTCCGSISVSVMTEAISSDLISDSNSNKKDIVCTHCKNIVLKAGVGSYDCKLVELPVITVKAKSAVQYEAFDRFWTVDDIFKFENAGFTNAVDGKKYLICAECEMGPIGFQDLETKLCYVALGRVEHLS